MPDTKLLIAVRDDLAQWQKLNVVAFLASGIAACHPGLVGEAYRDAADTRYTPLFGHPVLVHVGPLDGLQKTRARAVARGLTVGVYTAAMFATSNDADNRAVVRPVAPDDLDLVGLSLYGPKRDVDKAVKSLKPHG